MIRAVASSDTNGSKALLLAGFGLFTVWLTVTSPSLGRRPSLAAYTLARSSLVKVTVPSWPACFGASSTPATVILTVAPGRAFSTVIAWSDRPPFSVTVSAFTVGASGLTLTRTVLSTDAALQPDS